MRRQRERFWRPPLGVALTTRGELAWLADRRVYAHGRVIARGAVTALRLEDDRTLRWWDWRRETWRFHDLRPWRGGGCPVRSRFHVVAESAEVVASKGDHWFFREPVGLIRACVRATGDDPVIARGYTFDGSGYLLDVAGVGGRWVVIRRIYASRYAGCAWVEIEVVSAVTRARGREGALACDSLRMPADGAPLVVTERGVPAWIARNETGSRLVTTAPEATIELDAGGPEAITGLAAEGSVVRWLRDGEPRSAVLE